MVAAPLTIAFTHPDEAPDAIRLFDREFIDSRGRSISFAQRFADVFAASECLVASARVADQLASALLVRPFSWQTDAREWRGAMIGLVCTRESYRGSGYAAQLLAAAEARCRALGLEFGVLWALQDGLYARQGWVRADCGMLGIWRADAEAGPAPEPMEDSLLGPLHALHEQRGGPRVLRLPSNYRHLLPPAVNMWALLEGESFALCGWDERTGYVHDIAGRDRDLPRLWRRLSACFGRLYVNVERGGSAHRWLVANAALQWVPQSLAMWKAFREDAMPFAAWHVPFFDRI